MADLDIALVIPDSAPRGAGNWVSAARWRDLLARHGLRAAMFRLSDGRPHATLVHALNARSTALPLLGQGLSADRLLVHWTGTDLWSADTFRPDVVHLFRQVGGHTVMTPDAAELLAERLGSGAGPIVEVPPAVDVSRFSVVGPRAESPHPLALLVAAIRPVKGVHRAIDWVKAARAHHPALSLAVVGPGRDRAYAERVREATAGLDFVHWVGDVAWRDMPAWYRAADLVLNCSESEGVSNALLEAMAASCPVVARDIPGNRAIIHPGETGWLFRDTEDFVAAVDQILASRTLATHIGRRAHQWVRDRFPPERERGALLTVYRVAGLSVPEGRDGEPPG